jgi:hypothetical protein
MRLRRRICHAVSCVRDPGLVMRQPEELRYRRAIEALATGKATYAGDGLNLGGGHFDWKGDWIDSGRCGSSRPWLRCFGFN